MFRTPPQFLTILKNIGAAEMGVSGGAKIIYISDLNT